MLASCFCLWLLYLSLYKIDGFDLCQHSFLLFLLHNMPPPCNIVSNLWHRCLVASVLRYTFCNSIIHCSTDACGSHTYSTPACVPWWHTMTVIVIWGINKFLIAMFALLFAFITVSYCHCCLCCCPSGWKDCFISLILVPSPCD